MKTSELIGPALDWAVAKCLGDEEHFEPFYPDPYDGYGSGPVYTLAKYDSDWSLSGPIIERETIDIEWKGEDKVRASYAWLDETFTEAFGPTPLIAAMRCFIASKLGDEVDVPKELSTTLEEKHK